MDDTNAGEATALRQPSFADALAPVLVLIGLLTLTIALFGIDATHLRPAVTKAPVADEAAPPPA
jgi:hypothetical protein